MHKKHGREIGIQQSKHVAVAMRCAAAALLLLGLPWRAQAVVTVAVSGDGRYEYNSNVFDLPNGAPVVGTNDFQHSDNTYTYGAAADLTYLAGRQKLWLALSDNEFKYTHFTQMDHNEYLADLGLDWMLFTHLDGTLEVERDKSMVAFTDVQSSEFVQQVEQRENGKIGWNFIPDYRLEGTGTYRTVNQDYQFQPDLDLTEKSGAAALQYLGRAGLKAGFSFAYSKGQYSGPGAFINPDYTQKTYSLTANYQPTGRTTLNAILGYGDRKSDSATNSLSGFTGEIDYTAALTGKTSVGLLLSRAINAYVANISSEIDSTATVNVRWQTTYLLGVIATYSYMKRDLPGQGDIPGVDRLDHQQYVALNLDYTPLKWLEVRPYFRYQKRDSNFTGATFNGSVVGIYFAATWQNSRLPDYRIPTLNLPQLAH